MELCAQGDDIKDSDTYLVPSPKMDGDRYKVYIINLYKEVPYCPYNRKSGDSSRRNMLYRKDSMTFFHMRLHFSKE